jgi:hypothetical protein
MKFYKVDMQGKIWLQRVAVPAWAAADEGRILYDTGGNVAFLGDNVGFGQIWTSRNDGSGSGLDADTLDGYDSGNGSGEIPISNGVNNTNLGADLLDGQHGSYYRNASNLNSGTVPVARLSGTYNIDISGDADTLDGQHGSYYRDASNLNAGTVPAARLSGTYNIDISGTADSAKYS